MLRHRLDSLESNGGRLTLEGTLFDGVAYRVDGARVVEAMEVRSGAIAGPLEGWDDATPHVLESALVIVDSADGRSQEEIGVFFGGERFEGYAYFFGLRGVLLKEVYWDSDGPGCGREWYLTGQLCAENRGSVPDWEFEEWHENGMRKTLRVPHAGLSLDPTGRCCGLTLEVGHPVGFATGPLVASERLSLVGPGVTDGVLGVFARLDQVTSLYLCSTRITLAGLKQLLSDNLEDLSTRGNELLPEGDLAKLIPTPKREWTNLDELDRQARLANRTSAKCS
jgi:hypothetical protein